MLKKLLSVFWGEYCSTHDTFHRSDFCPTCMKIRVLKLEVNDERGDLLKSTGTWPIKSDVDTRPSS